MGCRPRTRPPGALPPLHTFELRGRIDLHDAVDLAVGVPAVLARVHVLAVHVHGRDVEEAGFGAEEGDSAAAIPVAVELGFGNAAFFDTLVDVFAEVLML